MVMERRKDLHDAPSLLVPDGHPVALDLMENIDCVEALQPQGNTETHAGCTRSGDSVENRTRYQVSELPLIVGPWLRPFDPPHSVV
jgi:hypothetical protein